MNTKIDDPSSIIGKKIINVTSEVIEVEPNTGHEIFRFLIELSDSTVLDFLPGKIFFCDNFPKARNTAKFQIIDGAPDINGEEIVTVVTRNLGSSIDASNGNYDVLQDVALILSSGRAALNVYLCGGGSILHVESINGLIRHIGNDWHDFWTHESIELKRFYVSAQ
jgi:hypothetical protein